MNQNLLNHFLLGVPMMIACLLLQALLISAAINYYNHKERVLASHSFWATTGVITEVMMLIATLTAAFVTNSGKSAWFVGVLVLTVYLIFAMTVYLPPPPQA